ncbi:uncharacterized protein LOC110245864, partial [Exaiptasia diaphana]|uniref:THAP-type domain-containing protein n=1 Tax=Exaiptasia diaphana TaxID=2652724 RepID=A0A913XPY7_EXADI
MGYLCAVKDCGHNSIKHQGEYRFFRFPGIKTKQGEAIRQLCIERRRVWLARIFRSDLNEKSIENTRVCSDHFVKGEPAHLKSTTDPDWAPSLNLGHNNVKEKHVETATERYDRVQDRDVKKRKLEAEDEAARIAAEAARIEAERVEAEQNNASDVPMDIDPKTMDQQCQTDIT